MIKARPHTPHAPHSGGHTSASDERTTAVAGPRVWAVRTGRTALGPGEDKASLLAMAESVGNMGHWYWDVVSGEMNWSDQVWRMLGLDPTQTVANLALLLDRTHPDDRAAAERQFRHAVAGRSGCEFDLRILRGDGEVRTLIAKGSPELRNGRVAAMFGVLTDVTEAFAAIRSMREQHEMLDLAAELAQLGHWVWDCDNGAMSFCSAELARIHGLSDGEFRTRFRHPEHFAAAMLSEAREPYLATLRRALAEAEPYAVDYRIVTPDGAVKDIREIGQPLFDTAAGMTRFIGTVQDVTAARRREHELHTAKSALESQAEALRRSELKFRDIIENSIQGIVILRDFMPVFANRAYARMIGLRTPEDVLGLGDLRRVMAPDGEADAFWTSAVGGSLDGKTRRAAVRAIDGRMVWTDAIGRRIEWEGEPAFLVTVIDVTERHLAEEELTAKTHELQELNLQKDKLFSIIAHDLKGPFNSVIGFADLLAARATLLPAEKVAEYAAIVRDAAVSVHGLFDNLLTWAAFQLRDAAPRFAPLDLAAAVAESLAPLRPLAAEKGVAVVNAVVETAPGAHVLADADLLRIVLRNLISNGIKFSHQDGTVRVTAAGDSMLRITVQDGGIGMDAEQAARLFRLDRGVSVPGTRGEKGTGLGLYLCRDIVVRHGGTIAVEASPGRGCAFHVTLPRAYPDA
jgi:PAS domain S-box-containing protein